MTMKSYFFFLFCLAWSLSAFAGDPPVTLKSLGGQKSVYKYNLTVPNNQITLLGGLDGMIETGNNNWLIDPGFEGGTLSTANVVAGSVVASLTGSSFFLGKKAGQFVTTSTNGEVYRQTVPQTGIYVGTSGYANLEIYAYVANPNAMPLQICAGTYNGATFTDSQCAALSLTGGFQRTPSVYVIVTPSLGTDVVGYRIKTTSSSSNTLYVDNAYLGPASFAGLGATSAWTPYALTIGAVTTPPGQGTGVTKAAWWRQVGTNMEIMFQYTQTGAGTAGSGAYLFPLPTGYNIDTTKTGLAFPGGPILGYAKLSALAGSTGGTTPMGHMLLYGGAANTLLMIGPQTNQEATAAVGSAYYPLSTATMSYSFQVTVPIVEFQSSVTVAPSNQVPYYPVYSASFGSGGAVGNATPSTFTGNASLANTSEYTVTFGTNFFTTAPVCTATPLDSNTGASAPIVKVLTQATTSSVVIKTYSNLAAATAFGFNLHCQSTTPLSAPVPMIINSVVSDSPGVEKTVRVSFGGVTEGAGGCGATPCTIYRQSGSVSSITRNGTGSYTLNFPAGTFSGPPTCTCSLFGLGGAGWCSRATAVPTTTAFGLITLNASAGVSDGAAEVLCIGPK